MKKALLLCATLGCSGDKDPTEPLPGDPCAGDGAPTLALGTGGQLGFVPFADGEVIEVRQDPGGVYGLYIDLSTTGLDTTSSVSAFLRFSIGEETETTDVGASLLLQCTEEEKGWFGSFAPLDEALQNAVDVATVDGLALNLSGNATDAAGETGSAEVELVLSVPAP